MYKPITVHGPAQRREHRGSQTQSVPSAGNPQDVNLGLDDTEDTTPSACQKNGGSAGGRRPQGDRCEVAEACSPVAHTLKSVHSLKCG